MFFMIRMSLDAGVRRMSSGPKVRFELPCPCKQFQVFTLPPIEIEDNH